MATLSLYSPLLFRFSLPNTNTSFLFSNEASPLKNRTFSPFSMFNNFKTKASLSEKQNEVTETSVSELLDEELIGRVSVAKDASEVLDMIVERTKRSGGIVSTSDCCSIIFAAIDRNNADLALSIFYAMRSSFGSGVAVGEKGPTVDRWKWSRPDVHTYALLISGLAASLRVSDALRVITNVCRVGVSPGEEVHSKRRNRLEQQRLDALVFVKYNLRLEQRHTKRIARGESYDPISLSDMESDNEWITEKEDPTLPLDHTWMDANDLECFQVEGEEESSKNKKKRGPRNLSYKKNNKGKQVIDEEEIDEDDEDQEVQEIEELDEENEDVLPDDNVDDMDFAFDD